MLRIIPITSGSSYDWGC